MTASLTAAATTSAMSGPATGLAIEAHGLTKQFGAIRALARLDLGCRDPAAFEPRRHGAGLGAALLRAWGQGSVQAAAAGPQ